MTSSAKTILIVDDNPEDRHTYDRYLEKDTINTYKIVEAETGAEGLEFFQHEYPALILLDLNLPEMDELEFIEELKINNVCYQPVSLFLLKESRAFLYFVVDFLVAQID